MRLHLSLSLSLSLSHTHTPSTVATLPILSSPSVYLPLSPLSLIYCSDIIPGTPSDISLPKSPTYHLLTNPCFSLFSLLFFLSLALSPAHPLSFFLFISPLSLFPSLSLSLVFPRRHPSLRRANHRSRQLQCQPAGQHVNQANPTETHCHAVHPSTALRPL